MKHSNKSVTGVTVEELTETNTTLCRKRFFRAFGAGPSEEEKGGSGAHPHHDHRIRAIDHLAMFPKAPTAHKEKKKLSNYPPFPPLRPTGLGFTTSTCSSCVTGTEFPAQPAVDTREMSVCDAPRPPSVRPSSFFIVPPYRLTSMALLIESVYQPGMASTVSATSIPLFAAFAMDTTFVSMHAMICSGVKSFTLSSYSNSMPTPPVFGCSLI